MKGSRSRGRGTMDEGFTGVEANRDVWSGRENSSSHLPQSFQSGFSSELCLPPGFRFHPTDDELVSCYLVNKVANVEPVHSAIKEVDLNRWEPWDLYEIAKTGETKVYFFTVRDRKYPTGPRTNRATEAGYWKATGKDRPVLSSKTGGLVGMKKTLVFYIGRAPKGLKTNWIMHEYRLDGESVTSSDQECAEWVVCRIFFKNAPSTGTHNTSFDPTGTADEACASIPPLRNLEHHSPTSVNPGITEIAWPKGDSLESFAALWELPDLSNDLNFSFYDNSSNKQCF